MLESRQGHRSIPELFAEVITSNADRVAFRVKHAGTWIDVTWAAHGRSVAEAAKGLVALGVKKGDRVAILSSTRLEWVQCDLAIVSCGAVTVGIYPSSLAADCAHILNHSEAEILFVENDEQMEKIVSVRDELPRLRQVVVIDGPGGPSVASWQDFMARGRGVGDAELDAIARAIGPSDLASIVYTSGTTGLPKGAMISHGNILFSAKAAGECLAFEPQFVTLLFLPLAHVFARLIVYLAMRETLTTAIAEDLMAVPQNLREVHPHFIAGVPRIFEKVQEKVTRTAHSAGRPKRALFDWAVRVGHEISPYRLRGERAPWGLRTRHALADRLVLRKVREGLGGRLVWAVSGSAPLNKTVAEFFHACGVTIIEGLGMTENTSLSNVNLLRRIKFGTVGPVVPGVEMKLAPDGEVLFRGPNVMRGYFKDPEATAAAIDAEGWLHSGDIGEIDEDGYLIITDRKKDLIITSGGKKIAPQRIEMLLRTSPYISHAIACGDRRKFISVLVTLDLASVRRWARDLKLAVNGDEALAEHPEVRRLIEAEIAARNHELASFETIKRFAILPRELSVEEGDLTATQKLRRKTVIQKYGNVIEELYRD